MALFHRSLRLPAYLIALLIFPLFLHAQTVSFPAFAEIPTVCQVHSQPLLLSNPGGQINGVIQVIVKLPCGLKYVPGTIAGANEANISDLQQPIFELNGLTAGAILPVSLDVQVDCAALPCLDQGQLFNTMVTITSNGNSTTFTSDLYNVETPRLVITKVVESYLEASQGQTIIRTITIRNTRNGRLSGFLFSDKIPAQLVITTANGTDAGSNPQQLLRSFGPPDFQQVGNNDEFLDFNEEIIISEEVHVSFCSFNSPDAITNLTVSWGCNTAICQSTEVSTIVSIEPLPEKGRIDSIVIETSNATCYDGENFTQKWSLKNTSAYSSILSLNLLLTMVNDPNISFVPGSLQATLNGVPVDAGLVLDTPGISSCGESVSNKMELNLPVIPPGEILEIQFDQHFCAPANCTLFLGSWKWEMKYEKSCAAPGDQFFTGKDSIYNTTPLYNGGISFEGTILEKLEDGEQIKLDLYIPKGLFHYNGDGWTASIFIPCGFTLVDTLFPIKNVLPLDQKITYTAEGTLIDLRYPLPMPLPNDTTRIPLFIEWNCSDYCDTLPCKYSLITSCEDECTGSDFRLDLTAVVQFAINDDCPSGFNPTLCAIRKVGVDCFDGECPDTLSVYLDHTVALTRLSLGLPDNDNNFQPDPMGTLDYSKIRLDRAMPGDTVVLAIEGEVVIDNPNDQYESLWLRWKFGNRGGMSASEFILLITSFVNLENTLTIKDQSTGLQFSTPVFLEFIPADSLVWCRIHMDSLAMKYPQVPKGFRLQHGDEISIDCNYLLKRIFRPTAPNYNLYSVNLFAESNVFIFNGEFTPEIERRLCPCPSDYIEYTCLEAELLRSIETLPLCQGNQTADLYFVYGTMYNFFPFEYRPVLDSVLTFCIQANNFVVNSAMLNGMRINNVSKPIQIPVQITETIPGTFCLEVNPHFLFLQEEHNVFELVLDLSSNSCEFSTKPQLARSKVIISPYAKRSDKGETDMSANLFYIFQRTVPGSKIQQCDQDFFSAKATWNFEITNCFPVLDNVVTMPNVWVKVNYSGNALDELELQNSKTGDIIPLINNRYVIGDLGVCDTFDLKLTAINSSCSEEQIFLEWGWSCDTLDLDEACYTKRDTCSFFSPPGALEMIPNPDSISAVLCDTMPVSQSLHVNADLGAIYDLSVFVTLPQGLSYVPGSAVVVWEAGTGTAYPVSDPVVLPDGRLFWLLDSLVTGLLDGLPGSLSSPLNGLDLQFQTITACGFISGAPLIYTFKAQKICDLPTNTVTKVSGPYGIIGLDSPHTLDINVNLTDTASCQQEIILNIAINTEQVAGNNESVSVQLPPGLSYAIGNCITNLSQKEPQFDGNRLVWTLEPGINLTSLTVTLFISADAPCEPLLIPVYTTSSTTSLCTSSGEECGIEVITGNRFIPLLIDRPTYAFTSIQAVPYLNGHAVEVHLTQTGGTEPGSGVIDLWLDQNGDGQVSPGDLFLENKLFSFSNSGSLILLLGPLDLQPDDWCKLLVVLDQANNCTCSSLVAPIQLPIIFPAQNQLPICWNDSIQLGLNFPPGTDIIWQGNGLSCQQCAQPWFAATNTGNNVETYVFLATQNLPGGCTIINEYVVAVYPQPNLIVSDVTICQGDTATLLTTPASSWIWSGPSILPGAAQVALVHPASNATYLVSIQDEAGCTTLDTAFVTVISLPLMPDSLKICLSEPPILNIPVDPGTVYYWSNAAGRLNDINLPNPTIVIKENFDFILFRNNGICQTVDTISVRFLDSLIITGLPDTFKACAGDTAMFQLSGGTTYTWTPSTTVICVDVPCSKVNIPVSVQQTYSVTSTSADGCIGTAMVTILPQENESLSLDTLFICEGQTVDIFGKPVSQQGLYCDTVQINPGCLDITCIRVEIKDSLVTSISDTICAGESIVFYSQTINMSGTYCQTVTTPAGCDSTICLTLTVLPATNIILPADTILCPGDTAWIQVIVEPADAIFNWSDGWPDLLRPVTTGINYALIVVNNCGRVDTAFIRVDSLLPPVLNLGPDTTFCQDSTYFLSPVIPVGTMWTWSDGYPNLDRPVVEEGIYILSLTDSCGQMVTDSILLTTVYCGPCHLDIPNLFTPNGDDVNDVFQLVKDCDILITMKIFNRWGNLVYEETSTDPIWNGIAKGEPQPMEVYAYVITFNDPGLGKNVVRRGDVTLVR